MNIDSQISNLNVEYYTGDFSDFRPGIDDPFYPKNTIYDAANKFYFVTSGKSGFLIDPDGKNESIVLSPGEMIFIPSGLRHRLFVPEGEGFEMYWIRFQFNTFDNNFFDLYTFDSVITVSDINHIKSLMHSIITNARNASLRAQLKSKADMITLSLLFLELAGAKPKTIEKRSMRSIAQYIDNNLNLNFTVNSLADMAHMHPYHFIRKFKDEFGVTPMKYITLKRMDHAQASLENTEMSISLIMANIGFSDTAHFSKTFKKHKGMSPAYFRAMAGKTEKIRSLGKLPSAENDEFAFHLSRRQNAIKRLKEQFEQD